MDLAEFEDAAGGFPVLIVAAPDEQGAALVVGDDAGDADGVGAADRSSDHLAWPSAHRCMSSVLASLHCIHE